MPTRAAPRSSRTTTTSRVEDLIPEETVVVTLSHAGYAKSQPAEVYQAQRRGGRGRTAARVKDEDFIDQLFVANSHDTVLCFSSRGKAYWLKVYQVPQAAPGARGRPIVNLLPLEEGERINAVLPVKAFEEDKFVFLATKHGTVKKTPLAAFARQRTSGIIAVELRDDDRLIGAGITNGNQDIMLFASSGKAIRFAEKDVRPMGRTAAGVRGLKLGGPTDEVIALSIIGVGPDRHGHRERLRQADADRRASRCRAAAVKASSASKRPSATAGSSARCKSRRRTSSC